MRSWSPQRQYFVNDLLCRRRWMPCGQTRIRWRTRSFAKPLASPQRLWSGVCFRLHVLHACWRDLPFCGEAKQGEETAAHLHTLATLHCRLVAAGCPCVKCFCRARASPARGARAQKRDCGMLSVQSFGCIMIIKFGACAYGFFRHAFVVDLFIQQ